MNTSLRFKVTASIVAVFFFNISPGLAKLCTYNTWEWNTKTRKSQGHRQVKKAHSKLTQEEVDPSSKCTVCEEDQQKIEITGIPSFQVCRHYGDKIIKALKRVQKSGWKFQSVIGYRVGRSRGPVDKNGLRTQFSNHSFGTAIDFNAENNGLYTNCFQFGPRCQLLRGGLWDPQNPLSITKGSTLYQSMVGIGFKWGGEIQGRQKDFMHFSLTGY